jgi:hypothetical protein
VTHVTLCFPKRCDERRLNEELEATGLWNCMNTYRSPTTTPKADGIHATVVTDGALASKVFKVVDGMTVITISMPTGVTLSAIERACAVVESHR